ncbi:MAG: NERD domain-containing protein [Microthrixaceae bacterium]
MGMLIPEEFPLSQLANDAERQVVRVMRDGLRDGWLIIPNVGISTQTDVQIDIVLIHPQQGIVNLEVKGHRIEVRDGLWCSGRHPRQPLKKQPYQQAQSNAFALRDLLRSECHLPNLHVEYAVAFPNTTAFEGDLPTEVDRTQLLIASDLDDPQHAIDLLMTHRWGNQALGQDAIESIVHLLCPDATFSWDPLAQAGSARSRLDDICEEQIKAMAGLDLNRRVAVTGAAGTGKSRLAASWARRAFHREERTLVTCYNEPLATQLRRRLPEDDSLRIGAFLTMALGMDGMEPLETPPDAGDDWWNIHAVGHLLRYWHHITEQFDTIIIDEAQDLSPAWIAALEMLLDPQGPRRMLLVADEQQMLYQRGYVTPLASDGWTRCELVVNCRNSYSIGNLIRRQLNGAPAPLNRPEASGLGWIQAEDLESAVTAVRDQLHELLIVQGRDPATILVETTESITRTALRNQANLVTWEDAAAQPEQVVCENVHRSKGLEVDTVLFVCLDSEVEEALLYIGLSRAVVQLIIIGPQKLADRLGL